MRTHSTARVDFGISQTLGQRDSGPGAHMAKMLCQEQVNKVLHMFMSLIKFMLGGKMLR